MPSPSETSELFPNAVYENRFGTVAVRRDGAAEFEITTFRIGPRLRRLPAAASGRVRRFDRARSGAARLHRQRDGLGRRARASRPDVRRSVRRSGRRRGARPAGRRRPARALRGGRAADGPRRPAGRDARVRDRAGDAGRDPGARPSWSAHLSGERIAAELHKLLAAPVPSVGLRLMSRHGPARRRSRRISPRNVGCRRTRWRARTCGITRCGRSMRRPPSGRRPAGGAAPRHRQADDLSPTANSSATSRSGRGSPTRCSSDLRGPRAERDRIVELVRQHMFSYEPSWSDAAVRRFIGLERSAPSALEDLLPLREADNVGSGLPADAGGSTSCARGSRQQLQRRARARPGRPRGRWQRPDARPRACRGPVLGRILDGLLEQVIADPARNSARPSSTLARALSSEGAL